MVAIDSATPTNSERCERFGRGRHSRSAWLAQSITLSILEFNAMFSNSYTESIKSIRTRSTDVFFSAPLLARLLAGAALFVLCVRVNGRDSWFAMFEM